MAEAVKFEFAVLVDSRVHEIDENGWYHVGVVNCDMCDKPAEYFHPEGGARCRGCPRP